VIRVDKDKGNFELKDEGCYIILHEYS
jgi:hypothetical protein